MERVFCAGKHLAVRDRPFRVKGVTYGGFTTRSDGFRFPDGGVISSDLAAMAGAGLNALRVYDPPPADLLALAAEHDLRLLVGIGHDWLAEESTGRAARRRIIDAGRRAVDAAMATCAGRPEVLAMAVGNEIPVDVVRLHGTRHVESMLSELIGEIHAADPAMLATYVSYPTTEFLEIDGLDLCCFNVFLEDPGPFRRYMRHLQVVSRDKPLLLTELGLASEIHGETAQADALDWQLRILDETGNAGGMVYAWTDEWAVNDEPVTGWGFGITTGDRRPKPALEVVSRWARRDLVQLREDWPRVSVVVCAYNEERTLDECLASLEACSYPDLEVLVCDDGSTDDTLDIARRYPFKVLALPHGGLSRARNAGMNAASGEIVAYLDADAACHPEWPFHLALSLEDDGVVATGGPNLPVPGAGLVERTVAVSPGSPLEVLVADDRAEHVVGANMAYHRADLEAVGGFNAAYTSAGDDVDVCWKLLDRGGAIAFSPAAQVFHHRRASVRGYLRQQRGYGRAERMLSGPHAHRFNRLGQARWSGFIYGGSRLLPSLLRPVVYHGSQGHAPYQAVTRRPAEIAGSWASALLPLAVPVGLAGLALGLVSPWFLLVPAALLVLTLLYGVASAAALRVDRSESHPVRVRSLAGLLHVLQPIVRAWGRLRGEPVPAYPTEAPAWWGDRSKWLGDLSRDLAGRGCSVLVGGPESAWDLEVSRGPFVAARLTTAVVWDWEPRWRARYHPGWALGLALLVGVAVAPWQPWVGLAIVAITVATTTVATLRLRSAVYAAVDTSTRGTQQ